MNLPFIKLTPDAVAPIELDGEITILSAEDGNVSFGQHYAFHTGIGLAIPDGMVGLLAETQPMGARGISVVGKLITRNDVGEIRVGMHNLSRTAFPVQKGMPIARLILLDSDGLSLEEIKGDDKKSALEQWQEGIADRKKEDDETTKKAAELHGGSVINGPGKNPIVDHPIKPAENSGTKGDDAKQENAIPTSKSVEDANVNKTPVPGTANPNAVKPPNQTGTPATV